MIRYAKIPRDTRLIEYASGWAMLLAALLLPADALYADLLAHSPAPGWIVFLGLTGLLHLVTVHLLEHADMLRATLSFVAGLFWTWVAMLSLADPHVSDFAAFTLGFACFLAFIVNSLSVRWTWSH